MDCIGIIPARFGSTRFPGKPLALIAGKPMIGHVIERARQAIDRIVVATDDDRIAAVAESFGAEAIMTSADIPNGTARCLAAALQLTPHPELIVNIQGDEPLVDPDDLIRLKKAMTDPHIEIATIAHRFPNSGRFAELSDPSRVKVVVDRRGNALYFSRAVIPEIRGADCSLWPERFDFLIHSGLYAYRLPTLRQLVETAPTPLSEAESLEQLRWLENGHRIHVAITEGNSIGVDTPNDIPIIEKLLK